MKPLKHKSPPDHLARLSLFRSTQWLTLIEVMVVIVVVTAGIVWAFGVLSSGQKLAATTTDRVQAINFAREGVEAVKNIRDTNYAQYPANPSDCWIVKDYDCGWVKYETGSYVLARKDFLIWWTKICDHCWYLSGTTTSPNLATKPDSSAWNTYRSTYALELDGSGYTITWSTSSWKPICRNSTNTGCLTQFTREIALKRVENDTIEFSSYVRWRDANGTIMTVELPMTLKNWRTKF